jgi:hypothetical protein
MATRRSSGSSSSGESNTGLVVSLVLFVLLTIGLGVTTYLGYSGQADLQAKAKQAEQKANDADKARRKEETLKLAYKIAAGVSAEPERRTFSGRKSEFASDVAAEIGALKVLGNWDINSQADQPPKTYATLVGELQQAIANANNASKARENDLAEAKKQFEADRLDLTAKLNSANKKLTESNAEMIKIREQVHGGSGVQSAKIKELSEQVAQLTNEKQTQDIEATRKIKELEGKIERLEKVRENLFSRVGPIMDKIGAVAESRPELREVSELHELLVKQFEKSVALVNDTTKGKVVRVDRERDLVYVDIGSADYIRPQVSFSIFPAGTTGKSAAARQRKGALEIVTVLEPHLSTAKIVEEASRYRDPIMPGDQLFNPAWSRTQKVHVALAGIFDLNGDGIDDTPDLISMLQKQGAEVDAYLDLKTRQVKGRGINEQTEYLILGEQPTLPQAMLAAEGNSISEAARDVIGKITEMKTKAKEMGVATVQYRKYLSSVGLRLPKGNPDLGASSYLRGTGSIKPTESTEEKPK